MSNVIVYSAISFIFGGIIGGAIVGRVVTSDLKKRMDDLEEQNKKLIDENVELRGKKLEEREKKVEKLEQETDLSEYNSLRRRYVSSAEVKVEEDIEENGKPNYIGEEDEEEDKDLVDDDEDRSEKIKLITERQFKNELDYRDREDLVYYQLDGTLVDATNEIIEKEELVVGSEAMDIIDETNNDDLYVLDDDLNKVYDITIEHDGSYTRDVLGLGSI